jgi:hypothetical protein
MEGKELMEQEIFADGIGSIVFEGGVMRIDLMSMVPGQRDKDNKPQMAFRQRIVMPVEGFLNSYKIFQEIIGKMEKSGLIARQPVGSGTEPVDGESSAPVGGDPREM